MAWQGLKISGCDEEWTGSFHLANPFMFAYWLYSSGRRSTNRAIGS